MKFDTLLLAKLSNRIVLNAMCAQNWSSIKLAEALQYYTDDANVTAAYVDLIPIKLPPQAVTALGKMIREQFRIFSKADSGSITNSNIIVDAIRPHVTGKSCAATLIRNCLPESDNNTIDNVLYNTIRSATTIETMVLDLSETAPTKLYWAQSLGFTGTVTWSRYYRDGKRSAEIFHLRAKDGEKYTHIYYRYMGIAVDTSYGHDTTFSSGETQGLASLACYMATLPDAVNILTQGRQSPDNVIASLVGYEAVNPNEVEKYSYIESDSGEEVVSLYPNSTEYLILKAIIGPVSEIQRKNHRTGKFLFGIVRHI